MESPSVVPDEAVAAAPAAFKPRAYQQEMLVESLRQNTIIAMDTGSGKTQIAVLRIQEELARCAANKLVWFLAPTVALAEQQHTVISKQLPMYQSRLLLGSDNVDHWSTQRIWDKILLNIRIVVSTPQILYDAMSHGFVKLSSLSLLVFDEAHRCVKASASNNIMRLYHRARLSVENSELPAVLGLTATPASKANLQAVKILEENLHAICRTPIVQREELLKFTHKPELSIITYTQTDPEYSTQILGYLNAILDLTLADIENDPYIKSLRAKNDEKSQEALAKTLDSGKTFTRKEFISLAQRAHVILEQLGSWAADVFVSTCAERFIEGVDKKSDGVFNQWEDAEKNYMRKYLSMLPAPPEHRRWGSQPDDISQKAEFLINVIAETYNPGYRVIVFAEQRVTAIMLAHLLSVHPLMKGITTKYFLGSSNYASRKSNITELSVLSDQKDVLDELRAGTTNIVVATSVLEEGIDVPTCNIVICFDRLTDLRSFIQRRGRARDRQSKLLLFIDRGDEDTIAKWGPMEEQLKNIYADNMRELEAIQALEDLEEESTEYFQIPTTEATLNHRNARQYLAYFCSTLFCDFTNNQPEFVVERRELAPGMTGVTAKVILPSFLDPSLRIAYSKHKWKTEKAAKKDAAFQVYISLYNAGLVDDNLMPIHRKKYSDPEITPQEKQVKLIPVSERWNPWYSIAQQRRSNAPLFPVNVCFESNSLNLPDMILLLPCSIPCDWIFELFWNQDITLRARLSNDRSTILNVNSDQAAQFTHELLVSAYQGRISSNDRGYLTLLWPAETLKAPIEDWLLSIKGQTGPSTIPIDQLSIEQLQDLGIGRTTDKYARPFFIEQIVEPTSFGTPMRDSGTEDTTDATTEPHIQGTTFPQRADFLHPIMQSDNAPLAHTAKRLVPMSACYIDRIPARFSKFALFVPSITHKIEVLFVAQRLSETVLSSVNFSNLEHVLTAISSSAAHEASDYQRYEFLGDSLLKLIASIHLVAYNPLSHEGLLSIAKDKIVSNARLAQTAQELHLDEFILTKSFTGRKWRPYYISQFENVDEEDQERETRELSTKTLADVVESLLGAAFLDGGYEKLEACAKVFSLPGPEWKSTTDDIETLHMSAIDSEKAASHPKLAQMEEMLGYKFNKPSILFEALTHPCSNDGSPTYQRLEFLGDSLLDHFVVQEFFHQPQQLSHQDMHLMRTAVANAHFLGFLCQCLYITEEREEAAALGQAHISTVKTEHKLYLWQMMQHNASWEIVNAQQETKKRYEMWGAEVRDAFRTSAKYPWAGLFRINANKFFSDIIESLLGAICIDSRGSLDACRGFLERIGLLPYLRRVIHDKVEILHPRNQLHEAAKSEKVEIIPGVIQKTITTTISSSDTEDSSDTSGDPRNNDDLVYTCSIRVGGEEIVYIDDGVNKPEVEARAAALGAEILRARIGSPKIKSQVDINQEGEDLKQSEIE